MPTKKQSKTISYNPEQTSAINAGSGVWATVAGPGSGKTSVLVARYQRLISDGVSPDQILALTFTNSAAKNMRDRAGDVQKMDRVSGFVTFHSLCLSICTAERENFGFTLSDMPLALEPECNKIASDLSKKFELNFKTLRSWISLQKRNNTRPKQALEEAEKTGKNEKLALAYKAYDARLREAHVLDFDSMLLEVVHLLKTKPEIRERFRYDWVMVDESQDCDSLNYVLIQLVARENIFFVGDCGQSIFGFRGADPTMFLNIHERFPTAQKIYLSKNHRSTKSIVDFLKEIGPVEDLASRFHTDNEIGVPYQITGYPSAMDESQTVAEYALTNPKIPTAVLARTNKALRATEDALSIAGVKYRLLSKAGFWAQSEVKTLVAYAACMNFPSDYALSVILRSGFAPTKYLKRKELLDYTKTTGESSWSLINEYHRSHPNHNLSNFISFIHSLQRYKDLPAQQAMTNLVKLLGDTGDDTIDNSPTENIQELLKVSKRFASPKEFVAYAMKVANASKSKSGVVLGTCHGAKGLEWNTVFLTQVCDGVLPHSRAESLAEESCIFFVGCSRAEKDLRISYTGVPSPFLTPFIKKEEPESLEEVFA